jgi:hypothetical protein
VREWQVLYTERSFVESKFCREERYESNLIPGNSEILSIMRGSVMILGFQRRNK